MQINLVTGNNNINNSFMKRQIQNDVKTNAGNMFGPQCKVTISREGRRLSEQSKAEEPKSITAASTERLLLRQQEQAENSKNEYSNTISEISELMSSLKNSYAAGEDKETITEKQQALQRLLDLKARQEEENKQREKDAADSAASASKQQEEIDKKNGDLYMMLKSFEEQEKDEQDGTGSESTGGKGDVADAGDEPGSVGDQFEQSAARLGASAAKRELQAKGLIDDLSSDGYDRIAQADAMMRDVQEEIARALDASGKENLSEDEKNQLMSEHTQRAEELYMSNSGEAARLRKTGFQKIQDAKELSMRHIEINPLDGVDEAKQAIMDAGVTAAFQEASQSALDKTSDELEERVQEAIDNRDNVDSNEEEAKAAKEEENAETLEEKQNEQEDSEKNVI